MFYDQDISGITTVEELCKWIGQRISGGPLCVETGATFLDDPENYKHQTTFNIVWYICNPKGGYMYSFDNQKSSLDLCKKVLGDEYASFDFGRWKGVLGDSVEELLKYNFGGHPIDLLYLDSAEDADVMFNEYKAVERRLSSDAVICCDDALNGSVKTTKLLPYLKKILPNWYTLKTPQGVFVG